jgi:hypothetical protein
MLEGMTSRLPWLVFASAVACHARPAPTLFPAGDEHDEGHGQLAQASAHFLTDDELAAAANRPATPRRNRRGYGGDAYGGDLYGGYGGDPYGGGGYAGWRIPTWNYSNPNRTPRYNATTGLAGSIDGVVTWNGAAPARIATTCGAIDNPSVRVGSDKLVGGVLVYIERIDVGRTLPNYGRPASVGGMIAKRGCTLLPAVQIMTPLPAPLAIHGDAQRTKVRVTPPSGASKPYDLQEAGRVQLEIPLGVTRVEGDDGMLTSAWVLALDTPYYAITDDAGRFRIDELAAGTYEVTFWQAPLAVAGANGRITYGAPVIVHRSIKVDAAKPARLDVSLGR